MFLGIDLGTSAVKALLVDENDAVVAQASSPLDVSRPEPLWSEQDPAAWWAAVDDAVAAERKRSRQEAKKAGGGITGWFTNLFASETPQAEAEEKLRTGARTQARCRAAGSRSARSGWRARARARARAS